MNKLTQVSDFLDPALDVYARLNEKQLLNYNYPELGYFIAESDKVIMRAINAGYQPVSFLVQENDLEKAKLIFQNYPDCPVFLASKQVMMQLTGFELLRGQLCCMQRKENRDVNEILANSKRIVVLENIFNPTNVGAIFRSAAALNMDAVLLTIGCSDPLYRRSARVSMGTVFQIPYCYIEDNPQNTHQLLKKHGFKSVSMALKDNSVDIDDESLNKEDKLAIFMGSEETGLKDETISLSDYVVKIPMSHNVDSLNVAAASAVAFWQLGNKK